MDNELSPWESVFSKRGYRFLLFLASYMFAVAVTLIIIGILQGDIFGQLHWFLGGLFYLPLGLSWVLVRDIEEFYEWKLAAAWVTYFIITYYGVAAENSRTAKTIYFIFVLLLIFNIGGCVVVSQSGA